MLSNRVFDRLLTWLWVIWQCNVRSCQNWLVTDYTNITSLDTLVFLFSS